MVFKNIWAFWRGVLEFKPFSKLFQTGILDKRCFKIVGMRSLKPFWWKHFANTKAFQDKLFLKPCLLNGVIYKTFEIKGAFLKQVEINASFENRIFWKSFFSKTKHLFFNGFESNNFWKLGLVFETKCRFPLIWKKTSFKNVSKSFLILKGKVFAIKLYF